MAENSLQTKIIEYLNSLPDCIAENVSGNAAQSGRADINACYKGCCLKIELKDPETGYKPSAQQLLYLKKWEKAGAIVGVCYSVENVKELLRSIDYMKFKEGMTTKEKVEALQRYILVHSMLYYEMNDSVIPDERFDKYARLLAKKIQKYGVKKIASTQYGYVFYDFDGNTGFDLISRLTKSDRKRIEQVAISVLNVSTRRRTE